MNIINTKNVVDLISRYDFCIGCGICSAICPTENLIMKENSYGEYRPIKVGDCPPSCDLCLRICPFGPESKTENSIAQELFSSLSGITHNSLLGWYLETYIGAIVNIDDRLASASGGLTSLLLEKLIQLNEVDKVIALFPKSGRPWYKSRVLSSIEEIRKSRGSVYHSIEISESLRDIRKKNNDRYAIVVLPCFAKGLRKAQELIPSFKSKIRFILGLTCGGLRSIRFPECLAALSGVSPEYIFYRIKNNNRKASDFKCQLKEGKKTTEMRFQRMYGFLWNNKYALHKSCFFCDDVFGELCDITFMDAWLPEFIKNPLGTNLVIVRNPYIKQILLDLKADRIWNGKSISPKEIIKSQINLIKFKRDTIPERIKAATGQGFIPPKRVDNRINNISKEQINLAARRLEAWHQIREFIKDAPFSWINKKGIRLRISAWLHCFRFARLLRKFRIKIYYERVLYGLGWVPNIRAIVIRILTRLKIFKTGGVKKQ